MSESNHPGAVPGLQESPRFRPPPTRRDFLGIGDIWSAVIAFGVAIIGALRLPMPAVFPESNAQIKPGPPDAFAVGSTTHLSHVNLWIFRDNMGLYAISSICTHLGCIVGRDGESGEFKCPCHGSEFEPDGKVFAGPAPSALSWLDLFLAPDGQVVVDQRNTVPAGTRIEM